MKFRLPILLVGAALLSGCFDAVAPIAAGAAGRVVVTDQKEKADLAWAEKAKKMDCTQLNAERKKYRNLNAGVGYGYNRQYTAELLMDQKGCEIS